MVCPYCQARLDVVMPASGSPKHDYAAYAGAAHTALDELPPFDLRCGNCGSAQQMTAIAGRCPSCRSPLVVSDDLGGRLKSPDGVVPFVIDKERCRGAFQEVDDVPVVRPLRPEEGQQDGVDERQLPPALGFDDRTTTDYRGQRGDHYYTTETYTTQQNGQTVTNTRQVQHTAWSHAQGVSSGTCRRAGPWRH
jgi:uncharacterized protein YbaR (Trm112 family)